MGKSARILGQEVGLSSQEMNRLLKEEGYLEGVPGDYSVTEKGEPFANEKDFHRGTGGYSQYNRYWTERTWDDSITDELDLSPDRIRQLRADIAQERREKREEREREKAELRASQQDMLSASEDDVNQNDTPTSDGESALAAAGLIVLVSGAIYGIYKAAPHVKKWWKGKVVPYFSRKDKRSGENKE